jgi:hypothetical protein
MGVSIFDYLYLLSGVVFIGYGWLTIRSARDKAKAAEAIDAGF